MPRRSDAEKDLPRYDLKAVREQKGLTQQQAAEILHASQGSIARWESDGSLPLIYRKYWELYWKHTKAPAKQKQKKAAAEKDAEASA